MASGPPLALALVLAAALVLQLPALRTPFFADDFIFLDQVSRGSLVDVLAAPDPIGNFHRPVGRQLYFWLLARAGGSPLVFHAVNLALWLAVVGLLYAVARRIAGARAGLIAAGLLALHYAADVPVRWASGSQDLIAVAGALGAIRLHLAGRGVLAGVTLLVALLSKETVALTPLVAAIAGRGPDEPWRASARRAWPLAAAVALWVLIVWGMSHGRAAEPGRLAATPAAVAAALVHLVQVAAAIEWTNVGPKVSQVLPMAIPLALVLLALVADRWRGEARAPEGAAPAVAADARRGAGAAKQSGAASSARSGGGARAAVARPNPARSGIVAGLVWAAAGAAPIAPVAGIWSAYYYVFALCGVAVALGSWLAARPRAWAMVAAAVLALNSARSGALPHALVRGEWTTCSHVNRRYIERGTHRVQRYLGHLRAARPTLPPRSTLFFSGVPGAIGFQTTDGPLVRWAYRDSSLRSYFLNAFDREKARRGPTFFFEVRRDSLCDVTAEPHQLIRIALGAILGDKPEAAFEMLRMERERNPESGVAKYWMAWVEWDLGERERALEALKAAGFQTGAGPAPDVQKALQAVQAGDTARAYDIAQRGMETHVLDAAAHAMLADLAVALGRNPHLAVVEAYAARLLAPEWSLTWRRWAMLQAQNGRYLEAAVSLRRYFDLGGEAARSDSEAQRLANSLRRNYPVTIAPLDGPPQDRRAGSGRAGAQEPR